MLINKADIKNWLRKNGIENYNIDYSNEVTIFGNVNLSLKDLYEIPISIREVKGDFICKFNNLSNLIGFPSVVYGNVDCSINKLTSLDGFPKKVYGNVILSANNIQDISKLDINAVKGDILLDNNKIKSLNWFINDDDKKINDKKIINLSNNELEESSIETITKIKEFDYRNVSLKLYGNLLNINNTENILLSDIASHYNKNKNIYFCQDEHYVKVLEDIQYVRNEITRSLKLKEKSLNILDNHVFTIKEWLDSMNIRNYYIRDNKIIDVDNSVDLSNKNLISIPFKFGKINGDFNCSNNALINLENAPNYVNGDFNCSYNFITSLKHLPEKIKGGLFVKNNRLTSLNYIKYEEILFLNCSHNKITSLKGCPPKVKKDLNCNFNELVNLDYFPSEVGNVYITNNKLSHLLGCPKIINGNFIVSNNELTSLEGCPQIIKGDFYCNDNNVAKVNNFPEIINGNFNCNDNQLKSLTNIKIENVNMHSSLIRNKIKTLNINTNIHVDNKFKIVKDFVKSLKKINKIDKKIIFLCQNEIKGEGVNSKIILDKTKKIYNIVFDTIQYNDEIMKINNNIMNKYTNI